MAAHCDFAGNTEELLGSDEALRLWERDPHGPVREAVKLPHLRCTRALELLLHAIQIETKAALNEDGDWK